ncbi:hypothetical protein DFA_05565 [Cavenderia fasciculata]|uniref:Uncharacterized protein n=1 Tax=Cavenderia fasciculata TaxID=261658 RepID=F4PLL1_CACFS|nr:uncharacterized protein DFA_05565 [Cavenderia fasciculata]EGG23433.1 hypothetical protein DFA_05565 [Cavenderia fasciculata]|eukprot:XP_004361284.1 hypothetical protein DFA_05565 [Cavenderia fasciculata]
MIIYSQDTNVYVLPIGIIEYIILMAYTYADYSNLLDKVLFRLFKSLLRSNLSMVSKRMFMLISSECTTLKFLIAYHRPSFVKQHLETNLNLYSDNLKNIRTSRKYVLNEIPTKLKHQMERVSFTHLKLKEFEHELQGFRNLKQIIFERCEFNLGDLLGCLSTLCPILEYLDMSDNPKVQCDSVCNISLQLSSSSYASLLYLFLPRKIDLGLLAYNDFPPSPSIKHLSFKYTNFFHIYHDNVIFQSRLTSSSLESIQIFSFKKKELQGFHQFVLINHSIKSFIIDVDLVEKVMQVLEHWQLEELVIGYDQFRSEIKLKWILSLLSKTSIKIITIQTKCLNTKLEPGENVPFFFFESSCDLLYGPTQYRYSFKRK